MAQAFGNIFKSYIKYRRFRKRIAKVYYSRLIKAALFMSIVPIMVIFIMMLYAKLTLGQGLLASVAVLFGSSVFVRPYLSDLSSLTDYVEQLSLDRKEDAPPLSFLSNVEQLSSAVKNLHKSWENKTYKLESAIAESKILFDTLPDIIMMLDKNNIVLRANNVAFISLGHDIIGKNINDVIKSKGLVNSIEQVNEHGVGHKIDVKFKLKKVEKIYAARVERFPVHSKGNIATIITMLDVTHSKRTKQMLKDFVSNASHEIRTPLTSLVGFIETMQHMDREDHEARDQFIGIMAEQTEHMKKLVDDLLSLSKVEMNENTRPVGKANLNTIINAAIKRTSWLANNKDIAIESVVDTKLPRITGDKGELEQVFVNFISNAVKYSPADTKIEISSSYSDKSVTILVKDQGEGIKDEDIPRVTERFFRVDKVRSRKVGGTGIGLAIVKHILNRHNGDLHINSEFGKGSTFSAELPING